ncbi:MAG: molybdopterin-dependent oxidoreductase [Sphingopyxis sp.]|nr:molybdopterin-dependent oxidoreductase [Sphingopyxis sp.]
MTTAITTPTRRALVGGIAAAGGGLLLSGCDAQSGLITSAETVNYRTQRWLQGNRLAREFSVEERSPVFRMNGNIMPRSPEYQRLMAGGFADWRLRVDGMVTRPLALSLRDLLGMPSRTQTTRHDCVEGWSAIGQWTGTPLAVVLRLAGVAAGARYVVFHCADDFDGIPYYESIDMADAWHPQTILAWGMNGARLPIGHGAPVRLRVERQLGYKHAKFVMRIELRRTLAGLHGGKGGFWEDTTGYEWYAGI